MLLIVLSIHLKDFQRLTWNTFCQMTFASFTNYVVVFRYFVLRHIP